LLFQGVAMSGLRKARRAVSHFALPLAG